MYPSNNDLLHIIDNMELIVIVGLKAGQGVLATVLKLVNAGVSDIHLIKDCRADNNDDKLNALLDHVFPSMATNTTLQEFTKGAIQSSISSLEFSTSIIPIMLYKIIIKDNNNQNLKNFLFLTA